MPENTKDKKPKDKDIKKTTKKPNAQKEDEKKVTQTRSESKGTENNDIELKTQEKDEDSISPLAKVLITVMILAIAIFLVASFFHKVDESTTEYRCKAFESDPTLNYPCNCVPLIDTDEKVMDDIEKQTEALCRCTCDIGNEEPYIVDIRVADE